MESLSFLPGPVKLHPQTLTDLAAFPLSHRCEEFKQIFHDTCSMLSEITNAKHVALMMGSGTLANEMIAAQLSTIYGKGVILSNGEFGERLVDQATRLNLSFKHFSYTWGSDFNYPEIEEYILSNKPAWLWFVHLETSTGILNNLPKLAEICKQTNTKICLDCMSSIGNMPLDLSDVYLAAASSGKGLAGLNGIALVFSNHIPIVQKQLPKYLDLGYYYLKDKIPFTFSYNLLFALYQELKRTSLPKRFEETANICREFTTFFNKHNVRLVGNPKSRVNFIFTLEFDKQGQSLSLGDFCAKHNVSIHYRNDYLKARNWVQIIFMGHHTLKDSLIFFDIFDLWAKEYYNAHKYTDGRILLNVK